MNTGGYPDRLSVITGVLLRKRESGSQRRRRDERAEVGVARLRPGRRKRAAEPRKEVRAVRWELEEARSPGGSVWRELGLGVLGFSLLEIHNLAVLRC